MNESRCVAAISLVSNRSLNAVKRTDVPNSQRGSYPIMDIELPARGVKLR